MTNEQPKKRFKDLTKAQKAGIIVIGVILGTMGAIGGLIGYIFAS